MAKEINADYGYPVQMANIRYGKWRLGEDTIFSELQEIALWLRVKYMADTAPTPSKENKFIPGSSLVGYGWEWVVYTTTDPSENVIKVPRGVFAEVNSPEYLENCKHAYGVVKKYLPTMIPETSFTTRKLGEETYIIEQKRIYGDQYKYIDPVSVSNELRAQLINLAQTALVMLNDLKWMPDMDLKKRLVNGKRVWSIWNLIKDVDDKFQIVDFTYYHDPFRMYPRGCKRQIEAKTASWKEFLLELENKT